ncbi:olfactory receptor 6F1-like [Stegastes partitus]|uniref:Olfactory receptor n=1 Tax=Stegastes partitus TaxID=144197 RepID=A0A9Y4NTF9_9TELE|nr:PREDICTED: olfactory receptor 6F1-like [Stegastes partitus]
MDLNITYITLTGHIDVHRYGYLYFFIMLNAYILIICCNVSIVSLTVTQKNLHEPMYVFISALLLNSILFSTAIYPKLLADFLSEKQVISYQACLFQVFLFYSLSCSEFMLLAAMAYDRYVSICKPLHYTTIMRKTTVIVLLVSAWIIPACHVALPLSLLANQKLCKFSLNGLFCNNSFNSLHCISTGRLSIIGVIVVFDVVLLPILFIILTYTKILIIAYQSCGEVRKKAAQTCLPHLFVLINFSCLFTYDFTIVKLQSDFPPKARFIMTLQIVVYTPICNPIIYGLKMKEISTHLKMLFCPVRVNRCIGTCIHL